MDHFDVHADSLGVAAIAALDQVSLEGTVAQDVVEFGQHEAEKTCLLNKICHIKKGKQEALSTWRELAGIAWAFFDVAD